MVVGDVHQVDARPGERLGVRRRRLEGEADVPDELPPHLEGPAWSRCPRGWRSSGRACSAAARREPKRARPPSGGMPYLEPGVVSPTQPTSMTVGAATARAPAWRARRARGPGGRDGGPPGHAGPGRGRMAVFRHQPRRGRSGQHDYYGDDPQHDEASTGQSPPRLALGHVDVHLWTMGCPARHQPPVYATPWISSTSRLVWRRPLLPSPRRPAARRYRAWRRRQSRTG